MPLDELQVVVDENDNVIGSKKRRDITKQEFYRVSALWLTDGHDKVMLARRSYNKNRHPGKWGPAAAGTVAVDETYDENIVKEVEEELGLKNIEFKLGPKVKIQLERSFFTQYYLAKIDPKTEINFSKKEVAEVRWFNKKDLLKYFQDNPEEFVPNFSVWIDLFIK